MADESVILINLLKVKPGKQEALLALLKQNIDTVVRRLHGWKTTRLIAAKDGAGVVIYSEWETPAAVEAMRSDPRMEERTRAVVALVKEAAALSDGKVILVGHSAGGMTISAVAEQVPDLLLAIVYLAGFMVPNGMPLLAMLQHEALSSALAPGLFVGDPAAIGATRIHVGSTDAAYRSLLKAAFYGDLSQSEFAQAASQLHCDESNAGALAPSAITPARFGTVPRHYIRCTQDRAIPLTGQDHMIAAVDGAIGNKTTTHTLASSHSPFLSQPVNLATILIDICVQSSVERSAEAAVGLDT